MDDHCDILQILKDNKSDVTSCDFGGNYLLAIGSSDKTVRILEWKTGLGFVDMCYSPLHSHKYGVTWVRFSPQGTMLASSSVDGTTALWNVKTGIKVHTMVQSTKSSVRRCEFTPDSTKLITIGDDGIFCFWDLVHRTLISVHQLHNDEDVCVQGLAISPDSEYLLTGDGSGLMKLWRLPDINLNCPQPLHISKNIHDGIISCEFSPSFEITNLDTFHYKYLFATCGAEGSIKIWSLELKRKPKLSSSELISVEIYLVRTLEGHENDVLSIRFNSDGSLIASSGLDKTVKLWQTSSGKCIKNFIDHSRYVNCCAFSKTSMLLASGSNDKSVIIWDLNRNVSLNSELIKRCSTCSHFSGDVSDRFLAEELVLHQSENEASQPEILQILQLSSGVSAIHFHSNNLVATAGGGKTVSLWKRKPGKSDFVLDCIYEGHKYNINQVEISPCGTKLISCSINGTIIIWDIQIGLTYEMLSAECSNSIRTSRFSPSGEFIAAGGDDQKLFLWDAKSIEFIKTLQEHKDAITSVAFTPDSKLLASTCSAGDLKIYDLENDCVYATKDCVHDLGASSCDFSCQGTDIESMDSNPEYVLATCGNDSLIKVWKVKLNHVCDWKALSSHGGNVSYVRFATAEPYLLVSCATDCTARIWNVESGLCLHVFDHHTSIVTSCAFSRESTLLATGSLDKTVIIWSLPNEKSFEEKPFLAKSRKTLQHWSTSDIVQWFDDLGLTETSHKVKHTALSGQQILALKIDEILDLIGTDGEERKTVALHLFWIKSETKRNPSHSRINNEAPHHFLCPITHEIMTDPVICSDGFTYERAAITEWLLCGKHTSPMTNEHLRDLKFLPNISLKTHILKYLYGEDIKD